jgi:hypothetical protein
MRRIASLALTLTTCASVAYAQDDGEARIRRALEGRVVLAKMDLPAIDAGVYMYFDDANVSFDEVAYNKLIKEYGVAVKKGSRSKITGVRISAKGIELDLDGGGSPGRDWVVGGFTLTEPLPAPKSERELEFERRLQAEPNAESAAYWRTELEHERQRRTAQDDRNRENFNRFARMRTEYIEANRKTWGSKLIVVVRSRKPSVTVRDMMASLAKYVEILPREPAGQ